MQHTPSRLESSPYCVIMGKTSPIIWGLWGPLIALCNNMLQWCALLGAMNVNAPPPHHLLSSLKHNVSTMPTKGQFTEAGSPVGTHSAVDWSNTLKCSLWVLLATRDLVFVFHINLCIQASQLRTNSYSQWKTGKGGGVGAETISITAVIQ